MPVTEDDLAEAGLPPLPACPAAADMQQDGPGILYDRAILAEYVAEQAADIPRAVSTLLDETAELAEQVAEWAARRGETYRHHKGGARPEDLQKTERILRRLADARQELYAVNDAAQEADDAVGRWWAANPDVEITSDDDCPADLEHLLDTRDIAHARQEAAIGELGSAFTSAYKMEKAVRASVLRYRRVLQMLSA